MEWYTENGHLVGMLDRDQRTAKVLKIVRVINKPVVKSVNIINKTTVRDHSVITRITTTTNQNISHPNFLGRISPHSSCKTRKSGHFWKNSQRLKQAIIVGIYLSIFTFPTSHSAPLNRKTINERMAIPEKWVNPCGFNKNSPPVEVSDSQIDLLTHIVDQTNIAYASVSKFKEDFAQRTFKSNSEELHLNLKDQHYTWLPSTKDIPKGLGKHLPEDYLNKLKLDSALLNVYEYLQKIAVGLEQVVWDQEDDRAEFETNFRNAEYELRNVLCELQMAILEQGIEMREDITRKNMPDEFRMENDITRTNIRNWLILRDYMNTLEYILEVFKHFQMIEN